MEDRKVIHITIISSKPYVAIRFEKLIALMENVDIVEKVNNAQEAIASISSTKPEVALIDLDLPDVNGAKLIEELHKGSPATQVVAVAQERNAEDTLLVLRTGASDFLTYEVGLDEFRTAIMKAGELSLTQRKDIDKSAQFLEDVKPKAINIEGSKRTGEIITVFSSKGGTGVTSLAVNIALALQDGENPVALVDGDMQFGDVGLFLNQNATNSITDLVNRINNLDKKIIDDVMVFHKASGLYLLPAPLRPEYADQVDGEKFSVVLEYLRYIFKYIVINTSSYISDPCLAALDAGDIVLYVTTPEIASIWGARMFLGLWEKLGMSSKRILLTLNRNRKNITITPKKISERLNFPVSAILDDDELVARAADLGLPFLLSNKDAQISKSVISIAQLLRDNLSETAGEKRFRLFERSLVSER